MKMSKNTIPKRPLAVSVFDSPRPVPYACCLVSCSHIALTTAPCCPPPFPPKRINFQTAGDMPARLMVTTIFSGFREDCLRLYSTKKKEESRQ